LIPLILPFSLREKGRMRGIIKPKYYPYYLPLTLTLSLRERGLSGTGRH
jgi:hypothetical protein